MNTVWRPLPAKMNTMAVASMATQNPSKAGGASEDQRRKPRQERVNTPNTPITSGPVFIHIFGHMYNIVFSAQALQSDSLLYFQCELEVEEQVLQFLHLNFVSVKWDLMISASYGLL